MPAGKSEHIRDSVPLGRDHLLSKQFLFYRALKVFVSQRQTVLQVNWVYCRKHIFTFFISTWGGKTINTMLNSQIGKHYGLNY